MISRTRSTLRIASESSCVWICSRLDAFDHQNCSSTSGDGCEPRDALVEARGSRKSELRAVE